MILREISIKLNEKDYLTFLQESNEHGMTAKELIYEMINYYIIIQKKRLKVEFNKNKLVKLN